MTQQRASTPAEVHSGGLGNAGAGGCGPKPLIYCNACTGLAPVVVESPPVFFGVQIASGLAALLFLLAIEISR